MSDYVIETRVIEEQPTAAMFATLDVGEIPAWLGQAYQTVASYLSRFGVGPVGMPYARYHQVGEQRFEVEAGFVASTPVPGEGDVEPSEFPAGNVAATVHLGPYEATVTAYRAIQAWLEEHDAVASGDPWEVYYSDPNDVPPEEWRTEIVQPYTSG